MLSVMLSVLQNEKPVNRELGTVRSVKTQSQEWFIWCTTRNTSQSLLHSVPAKKWCDL